MDEHVLIRPGDFLFSRANTLELVGACVIAKSVSKQLMLTCDKILRFTLSGVVPEWLLCCLRSSLGRREIRDWQQGININAEHGQERIRQIRLPLPPCNEQLNIVQEVELTVTLADTVESIDTTRTNPCEEGAAGYPQTRLRRQTRPAGLQRRTRLCPPRTHTSGARIRADFWQAFSHTQRRRRTTSALGRKRHSAPARKEEIAEAGSSRRLVGGLRGAQTRTGCLSSSSGSHARRFTTCPMS